MRMLGATVAALVVSACHASEWEQVGAARSSLVQRALETGVLAETGGPVTYEVADGYALADDVVLGPIDEVRANGVRRIVVRASPPTGLANDARVGVNATTRWPRGVLPVQFAASVPTEERVLVAFALRALERRTALRFPARTNEPDAIEVTAGNGCWSNIGEVGGVQQLSLGAGCQSPGVVVHEFMHAAGWAHEQCRADRDQFVRFHPENVRPNFAFNFDVLAVDDDDSVGAYDFDSVMHYGAYDFSDAGGIVLEPRDASVQLGRLGQRCGPSPLDLASLRATYPGAPRAGLEIGLSADELRQRPHEVGRTVVVDVGALGGWALSVSSSDRDIVETEGPGTAVSVVDQCDGLITLRITGQPKSGTSMLRFRLEDAQGNVAERTLSFVVEGTATNAPGAFSASTFYFYGDRVQSGGRVFQNVTLRDVGRGYEVWGNQRTGGFTCGPATCTPTSPASYASIRLFWVEAPNGPAAPFVIASGPGITRDAGVDGGTLSPDAGRDTPDASLLLDAGPNAPDASLSFDAGSPMHDAGASARNDAGVPNRDSGTAADAGEREADGGSAADAGDDGGGAVTDIDGGPLVDAGRADAVESGRVGAGAGAESSGVEPVVGFACSSSPSGVLLVVLGGARWRRRVERRRSS